MPAFILAIAAVFGISPIRLIVYTVATVAVIVGGFSIRQHYINVGWHKHAAKIEKQDSAAIAVNKKVEKEADKCSDANGFWDVITQNCKLEEAEDK